MATGGSNTSNGIEWSPVWTPDEESALQDLLEKFASKSTPTLYFRIALSLRRKTVRDVASRIIWMKKDKEKEKGKARVMDIGSDALPESSQVVDDSPLKRPI